MTPESLVESISITPYSLEINPNTLPQIEALIQDALELEERYKSAHENVGVLLRTDPEFRAFQTYHSNKLELQGPDLEETKLIIDEYTKQSEPDDLRMFAAIQAVTTDSHLIDVLGQHQANILVERISGAFTTEGALRPHDIRQLNWFCIQHKFFAGEYRETDRVNIDQFFDDDDPLWFSKPLSHPVEVTWSDIPDEMRKICEYMSLNQECPILAASVAHAWFTRVHPFHDGNGRTARLIANLVLIRNGWPPLTITKQHRDEYIDALRESDKGGDIRLLFHLFVKSMQQGLSEIENPDFWKRRYRLEAQKNDVQRHSDWIDLTRTFLNTLRKYVGTFGWTIERVSLPDKTTYQLLEEGDPSASIPIGILRHPDRREIKIHVGYMSNELKQARDFDTTIDGVHYPPTFYLRERNYSPAAEYPFVHRRSSQIPIKEFTFIPMSQERNQTKVLFGNLQPTPIEMSISQLCERLAIEIEELSFVSFEPQNYLDLPSKDFISFLSQQIKDVKVSDWNHIFEITIIRISEGNLLQDELNSTGIHMSRIGQILSSVYRGNPELGLPNFTISEKLHEIISSKSVGLALVQSTQQQMPPILVRKESLRSRIIWRPNRN
jgi:Fic family protein